MSISLQIIFTLEEEAGRQGPIRMVQIGRPKMGQEEFSTGLWGQYIFWTVMDVIERIRIIWGASN